MKEVKLEQGSPEWLAFRRERIGASDAPSLMGTGFKSPFQLWQDKMGLTQTTDSAAMKRGRDLEEPARQKFVEMTGFKMLPVVGTHDQFDYLMASFDGMTENGDQALEIKCPGPRDHATALEGKIPEKYKYQLQHQMMVSGLSIMFYFSFNGFEGTVIEVPRDQDAIDRMLEEEHKFYQKMKNKEAPDLTERDFQRINDPAFLEAAMAYLTADEQGKYYEEQKRFHRDALIALSGGNAAMCDFLKLNKSYRKGGIDEQKANLDGVDLSKYRKEPTEYWTVRRS